MDMQGPKITLLKDENGIIHFSQNGHIPCKFCSNKIKTTKLIGGIQDCTCPVCLKGCPYTVARKTVDGKEVVYYWVGNIRVNNKLRVGAVVAILGEKPEVRVVYTVTAVKWVDTEDGLKVQSNGYFKLKDKKYYIVI